MKDTLPRPSYNVALILEDMAALGWLPAHLARAAGVSEMTVSRFLKRTVQTAPTAKRMADALGHPVQRYFVAAGGEAGEAVAS